MKNSRRLAQIILNIVIPVAFIGLAAWLVPKMLGFFSPFVVGGIIALIANPLVRFLERRVKLRRKFGTVLIIGGALTLVVLGGFAILRVLVKELVGFLTALPEILTGVGDSLALLFARLESMSWNLPANLGVTLENLGTTVVEAIKNFASGLGVPTVEAAGNIAKSLPSVFVMVFIAILSAYFFLAEKEAMAELYHRAMPSKAQEYLGMLRSSVKRLVGGYFLAQFKIMGVVAAILVAGFLILGVPYAAIWAVLIAILDFLPVFGTGTVLIPWAILQIVGGHIYMALGLAACWLITQAVRQMIQPKVVGDSMGLNPLLTLFFLYLGFRFSGIGGMILAVPVGMLVLEFYKYGAFDSLIRAARELVDFVNDFRHEKENAEKFPENGDGGMSVQAGSGEESRGAGDGKKSH